MFEPESGQKLTLDDREFSFVKNYGVIYAQPGKAGIVYKLIEENEQQPGHNFALKTFYPKYRESINPFNTEKIRQYAKHDGLSIADRVILTKDNHPNLIRKFPDLEHSILMPWVTGKTWSSIIGKKEPLTDQECKVYAMDLARCLSGLESDEMAHCDISSKNVMFSSIDNKPELVDIEDMYAKDLLPPDGYLPAGTPGYSPQWILENGMWQEEADRYSAGILIAEILGWGSEEVREASRGDSFFRPDELGKKGSKRIKMLSKKILELNPEAEQLLKETYFAKQIEDCPTLEDWSKALGISLVDNNETDEGERLKAKLRISVDLLDFGIIKKEAKNGDNEISIALLNSGKAVLTAKIHAEKWLSLSQDRFEIKPGKEVEVQVRLREYIGQSHSTGRHYFPKSLVVQSNGGTAVIGGKFELV